MQELGDEIRANQRATDAVDEAVAEVTGTNRTDGKVLDILHQHGRMSAGEVAQHSGLTTGAVTAVIDRLERAGYARRVADTEDRRRVLVEATDRVIAIIEDLMGPLAERGLVLLSRYSEEELELLLDFTRRACELQERHAEWLRERLKGS